MGNTCTNTSDAEDDDASYSDSISVLTYNIWFYGGFHKPEEDNFVSKKNVSEKVREAQQLLSGAAQGGNFKARTLGVLEEIIKSGADVCCLQEVTHWSKDIIESDPYIRGKYDMIFSINGRYGCAMLVSKERKGGETFRVHPLPTHMGRDLISCEIKIGSAQKICIATGHFESLSNRKVRREQLKETARLMKPYDHSIVCGDFNFCSYRNYSGKGPLENLVLKEVLPTFVDIWPFLHDAKKNPGFTFDSRKNKNIRQRETMRYDRMLLSTTKGHIKPSSISLVGRESIKGMDIPPSDHYGLLAKFSL